MRVLVAGATGAAGRALIPVLAGRGHVVAGMARNPDDPGMLGGEPVVADALDPNAVIAVVGAFRPEVIVHQMTALPRHSSLLRFDRDFHATNRLRTVGTDILMEAARIHGVRRIVAQGYCGWPNARTGAMVKDEDDPLDPHPLPAMARTLDALRYLEETVAGAHDIQGVVLRYGGFYGPGTQLARNGHLAEQVRKRRFPLVGEGTGVWSFIHTDDVATATCAAVEGDARGIFNVVDDDPAPVSAWLPALAHAMGAPAPRHVPAWLARVILPAHIRAMMLEIRGGSNARFKRVFNWMPSVPSWRNGFAMEFGTS